MWTVSVIGDPRGILMSKSPIHAAYTTLLRRGRLTTNPSQAALVDRLSRLQHSLLTNSSNGNSGVYIYGDVGTGKSRIADLFAATVPESVSRRRVHFHEFMMDVHSRLHRARSAADFSGDPLVQIGSDLAQESRVVCFDEFQVTDIADAMILKRLFGAIWDKGGVMVATSNRHPERLYERGLNRALFVPFIEELNRRCEVWKMEGERDYRMDIEGKEKERVKVYFTEEKEFDGVVASTTSGGQLRPVTIPVMMNRELRVQAYSPESGKMLVRSTFRDLCETNLGSSDYHALCKAASTVYISGVRQFKDDELDFVRRLITLIDIAYESKVRVVCLASVPLFKLFENIVPSQKSPNDEVQKKLEEMSVRREGGSSSSMMSTFIGEMEWSATGLQTASLASGGAGETDVKFAIGRAVSRLFEMGSKAYGIQD